MTSKAILSVTHSLHSSIPFLSSIHPSLQELCSAALFVHSSVLFSVQAALHCSCCSATHPLTTLQPIDFNLSARPPSDSSSISLRAIEHYERSETGRVEIPRMLFSLGKMDILEDYVHKSSDEILLKVPPSTLLLILLKVILSLLSFLMVTVVILVRMSRSHMPYLRPSPVSMTMC